MMRPHRYVVFVLLSGCAATPAAMRAADSASLTQADSDRVAAEYRRKAEPDWGMSSRQGDGALDPSYPVILNIKWRCSLNAMWRSRAGSAGMTC